MSRPSTTSQKRSEFLPVIARAFAELGYRRTTTADLASRCGVRENVLYRLWADKRAMFIASIDYIFDLSARTWGDLIEKQHRSSQTTAQRLLAYEATHLGELGLHRIIFAGLSETDDPEIRDALARMYGQFQEFIRGQVDQHRASSSVKSKSSGSSASSAAAWAFIGLGTVANIGRELGLIDERARRALMEQIGPRLLDET